ncbi:MAG TPA: DUF6457 domain-containing protein [Gaiellaceae bacterium]|jgi:hypothetical protein|nr:DUF6457 domain-containing protein [Gaiellaceae bacterium]
MDDWLEQAASALGSYEQLTDEDAETLLKIARYAAHTSDDRRNAPLLAYLIGRSRGEQPLDEIFDAIKVATSPSTS